MSLPPKTTVAKVFQGKDGPRNFNKYHWFVQLNLVPLISQKILTISIPNFNIILRDIFGLHLFTGSGNRRVYMDS